MHSIGSIGLIPSAGLGTLTDQLPWAWFALMAAVDVALVVVVLGRRRAARTDLRFGRQAPPSRAEVLVLRSGWSVPRSRVLSMCPHQASYAWPLHSEYMVSRLV